MNSMKYWMALERVHGVGPAHLKEIHRILSASGISLSDIFSLTGEEITAELKVDKKTASFITAANEQLPAVEDEYQKIIDSGISIIPFFSGNFPEGLNKLPAAGIPSLLYVYGKIDILKIKGAAILGDMNVSGRGEFISYMAAKELASHGINVISGLAKGADNAAHRSALEYGGITMALLPHGILKLAIPELIKPVYDPERFLAVSCFGPGESSSKYNAFIRNRIICALSNAVFIVESPESGGIFEAAKSAHNLKIPLYTAEYAEYPANASGNKKILAELGGYPVRGKKQGSLTVPNMDRIIADVKFR
jgi:DNA processing protein